MSLIAHGWKEDFLYVVVSLDDQESSPYWTLPDKSGWPSQQR